MPTWGETELSKFFDSVHSNQRANSVNLAGPYAVIEKIDGAFARAGKNLIKPTPPMCGVFFLRTYYAFRAAAGLALAGQVVEAFVVMRSILEYAGYGLRIFADPKLERVFIDRNIGAEEMKAAFTIREVRTAISTFDPKLADVFDDLYQRSIDFGGHPNPHGMLTAVSLDRKDETFAGLTTYALSGDPVAITHALKSIAQAGLMGLMTAQHIFKAKFELLGIRAEIDELRTMNL
jgi:hypothetical protein